MYAPVLAATYGFADDYAMLYAVRQSDLDFPVGASLGNGRPISLVLQLFAFWVTDDVASLRWMRLATIAAVAAVGVSVMLLCIHSGRRPWTGLAMGLAVAALPSFQVSAAWSLLFVCPLAMLLALWAAWRTQQIGHVSLTLLWPTFALCASALIYQPAAMGYWLTLAVLATGPEHRFRPAIRAHIVVLTAASLVATAAWIMGRSFQITPGRTSLSVNVVETGSWFVAEVLPRALVPITFRPSSVAAAAVAAFMIVGLRCASRSGNRPWTLTGSLLALLPLSYLPNLAAGADTLASVRTMIALGPVALVLLLNAAEGMWSMLPDRSPRANVAAFVLGIATVALFVIQAFTVVMVFIARPQAIEWSLVTDAVREAPRGPLAFRPAEPDATIVAGHVPSGSRDEFGLPSTFYAFVGEPIVNLASREVRGQWAGRVPGVYGAATPPPARYVIDFDQLIKSRH